MSTSEIDRALHTQVLKREATKEKAYREERDRLDEEFQAQLGMGGTEMTKQELRKVIDGDRRMYYRTEELNDKLFIHYKGWRDLKNLDGWTGLRSLYGECNAFSRITGLHNCTQLKSLFLQENCISEISGLENCPHLATLNLSNNFVSRIEGLENCKALSTLTISRNNLGFGGIEDIEALVDTNITTLDIQDNKIDDPDVLPEVFARMKDLRVLYMKGNPAAKKIVNYRKSTTVYCKDLTYLDDRPVFVDDRRGAEAFNRGGLEEQRAEAKRIREEKNAKHYRNLDLFSEMVENARKEKRERDAMRAEDKFTDETDPVESFERRSKRLIEAWKEENKENLKDDAKEYAEKCLQAEREGNAAPGADNADEEQKAVTENRDTGVVSGDTASPEDESMPRNVDNRKLVYEDIWDDKPQEDTPVPSAKKDNRKLVYDDIWDDVPFNKSTSAATPSTSSASTAVPHGKAASLGPKASEDVFLPWADDALGMDSVPALPEELQRRKAALEQKECSGTTDAGRSNEDSDDVHKGSWHSKYLEQVTKTQAKLAATAAQHASKPVFAPPSRLAEAMSTAKAEVDQADAKVGATSQQTDAGELDEMD